MSEALGRRTSIGFVWRTLALGSAVFMVSPGRLPAAAGISDMAATRACWLRPSYAVSKCYSHTGGPYPMHLFLGRPSQFSDIWSTDGIVEISSVASNLSRIALTRRYIVVEYAGSEPSFGVIDPQAGSVEPIHLRSQAELQRYLHEQGEDEEALHFQTFEEIHRERGPWWKVYAAELVFLSVLVLFVVLVMAWIFRQRMGSVLRESLRSRKRAAR